MISGMQIQRGRPPCRVSWLARPNPASPCWCRSSTPVTRMHARPGRIHHPLAPRAQAAVADGDAAGNKQPGLLDKLKAQLSPFTDPEANARVVSLCLAQMLCSVATLMHDTYLPVYLSEELKLTNTRIGNLQAIAQFLCNASKSVSGVIGDLLSPARMIVFGTLLTTINKPMFALSGSVYAMFGTTAALYWITFGKVFDRMSKGVREAPSKALIGDLAAEAGDKADAAFALRQSLGTFGALLGASAAALAYSLSGRNYIATFALASLPAALALVLVTVAFGGKQPTTTEHTTPIPIPPPPSGMNVSMTTSLSSIDFTSEPTQQTPTNGQQTPVAASSPEEQLSWLAKGKALIKVLQPAYWQAMVVVCILYFARFDAGFITLRAKSIMPKAELPLLTSIMMVTQALMSAPVGMRAKQSVKARNSILLLGCVALIGANAAFACLGSTAGMMLGSLLVGIHMAMTHGLTLAMVSAYIPNTKVPGLGRVNGTAWSFTDFIFGVILAYSNSLAGKLADITATKGLGNIGCFMGGGVATLLSMLALVLFAQFGDLGREDLVKQKNK